MQWIFAILLILLTGCGKPAQIMSPVDGQVFQIETFSNFQVILQNNDYSNVTTEFRGAESLSGDIRCDNASGTIAQCARSYNQNGFYGSFGTNCDVNHPCVVTIVVRRTGNPNPDSVVSVRFQRNGLNGTFPTTTSPTIPSK